MSYTAADIVDIIAGLTPFPSLIAERIRAEWQATDPDQSLEEALQAILDEYARNIDTEADWSDERKKISLRVEVDRRLSRVQRG